MFAVLPALDSGRLPVLPGPGGPHARPATSSPLRTSQDNATNDRAIRIDWNRQKTVENLLDQFLSCQARIVRLHGTRGSWRRLEVELTVIV